MLLFITPHRAIKNDKCRNYLHFPSLQPMPYALGAPCLPPFHLLAFLKKKPTKKPSEVFGRGCLWTIWQINGKQLFIFTLHRQPCDCGHVVGLYVSPIKWPSVTLQTNCFFSLSHWQTQSGKFWSCSLFANVQLITWLYYTCCDVKVKSQTPLSDPCSIAET